MTKVTIQRDICLNLVVPLTATHNFVPLPPVPPVPPPLPAAPLSLAACAIESPVNAWWPPGYALGENKFTTTVFHSRMAICQDGHNCGKFIPHLQVAPAPNNMLTLLHIPLSSRKCNFSASTVKMNGKPTACMTAIAWPPTPMTYCSEPMSMPLADAPTAHLNSVVVGMTFGDWITGALAIAAGMALEYAFFRASGGAAGFAESAAKQAAQYTAGKSVAQLLAGKLIGTGLPSSLSQHFIKQGVGFAAGLVRMAVTGEGTATISLPIGGPFFNITPSVGFTATGGNWAGTAGVTGNAAFVSGTASATRDEGQTTGTASATARHPLGLGQGTVSGTTGKGTTVTATEVDPFGGFQNTTTTHKTSDGSTTDADSHQSLPNPL